MTHARIHKIDHGTVLMIDCSSLRRATCSISNLVLNMVRLESCCLSNAFHPIGSYADRFSCSVVWCWGWDGAGDLDGPDVDPIWERMPDRTTHDEVVAIKHDRGL